jgi:mono/diheme cytochrome c family protein
MSRHALLLPGLIVATLALAITQVAALDPQPPPPHVPPTPTVDRLAPPPTVENPTQADEGAYDYWLNCQPCHGDRAQGLTDEWRAQYPPEDQNCWESGCHGDRPYENGFTLPTRVPALVGDGSLERFETLGQLYNYMRSAMPYQAPGNLSDEEYLAITAFLAREHGVWDGTRLEPDTIGQEGAQETAPAASRQPQEEAAHASPEERQTPDAKRSLLWWLVLAVSLPLLGGLWIWHRGRRRD